MRNPKNSPKTQNKTKLGFLFGFQSIFLYTVEILKITIKLPLQMKHMDTKINHFGGCNI
jgi:hypothetical protein